MFLNKLLLPLLTWVLLAHLIPGSVSQRSYEKEDVSRSGKDDDTGSGSGKSDYSKKSEDESGDLRDSQQRSQASSMSESLPANRNKEDQQGPSNEKEGVSRSGKDDVTGSGSGKGDYSKKPEDDSGDLRGSQQRSQASSMSESSPADRNKESQQVSSKEGNGPMQASSSSSSNRDGEMEKSAEYSKDMNSESKDDTRKGNNESGERQQMPSKEQRDRSETSPSPSPIPRDGRASSPTPPPSPQPLPASPSPRSRDEISRSPQPVPSPSGCYGNPNNEGCRNEPSPSPASRQPASPSPFPYIPPVQTLGTGSAASGSETAVRSQAEVQSSPVDCEPNSPCSVQRATRAPSADTVEEVDGELLLSVLDSDASHVVADTGVRSVFANAIANIVGANPAVVRIQDVSSERRLEAFLAPREFLRRLQSQISVKFTVAASTREIADEIARSLDGISPSTCQMEIQREMAKAGKSYSITVLKVNTSRRTPSSDHQASHKHKTSDLNDFPPAVIAAVAFGGLCGLSCFACGIIVACRQARSAAKAAGTRGETSPNVIIVQGVPVTGSASPTKTESKLEFEAPQKLQAKWSDDLWSETSTDIGSNASSRPCSRESLGSNASSRPSSSCQRHAWVEETDVSAKHRSTSTPPAQRNPSSSATSRARQSSSVRAQSYGQPVLSDYMTTFPPAFVTATTRDAVRQHSQRHRSKSCPPKP